MNGILFLQFYHVLGHSLWPVLDQLVCIPWEPFVGVAPGMKELQLGVGRMVDGVLGDDKLFMPKFVQ